MTTQIRFDDGAGYERYMGKWSQLAGKAFLDWLAPKSGLRWLDVGCGNGAFSETLAERCASVALYGIDPSEAQLAYARTQTDIRRFRRLLDDPIRGPSVGPKLAAMASDDLAQLKARMREHLPGDATGRITYGARANAIRGRVRLKA